MTPRSLHRAAQRQARKDARKADQITTATEVQSVPSAARITANRANAQLSTGPRTAGGKIASSRNAIKTALTGRAVLLPTDDADRYERHLSNYAHAYQPKGERECELVQAMADAAWRLDRIPGLEEAIYCLGATEFAPNVAAAEPAQRAALLRMYTYLAYERQLRNLHLQEGRLHRLREKLATELKQLQTERQQRKKEELTRAARLYLVARQDGQSFHPADHGFEFSIAEIAQCAEQSRRFHGNSDASIAHRQAA